MRVLHRASAHELIENGEIILTVSSFDARPPSSLLPGVGHLHHLFFFAPLVGAVHFKHHGIVIHDLSHGTILHGTLDGVVVTAFLRNGLTLRAGSPFKEIDAGERTPHHFAGKLLRQASSVKVVLIFFWIHGNVRRGFMQSVPGTLEGNEINRRGERKWNIFLKKLQTGMLQKSL